ncbi:MAG: hypothetical protein ACRDSL_08235 [Pseudonocardiaceae bacterium]
MQINHLIQAILPLLLQQANVIHQCGRNSLAATQELAARLNNALAERYRVVERTGTQRTPPCRPFRSPCPRRSPGHSRRAVEPPPRADQRSSQQSNDGRRRPPAWPPAGRSPTGHAVTETVHTQADAERISSPNWASKPVPWTRDFRDRPGWTPLDHRPHCPPPTFPRVCSAPKMSISRHRCSAFGSGGCIQVSGPRGVRVGGSGSIPVARCTPGGNGSGTP